jgi:hypothetical protein
MIKDGVSISEKFVGLMMEQTSKSISALLKLKLTKKKKKNFFHLGISSPRV